VLKKLFDRELRVVRERSGLDVLTIENALLVRQYLLEEVELAESVYREENVH
jgi:hypothetical protein